MIKFQCFICKEWIKQDKYKEHLETEHPEEFKKWKEQQHAAWLESIPEIEFELEKTYKRNKLNMAYNYGMYNGVKLFPNMSAYLGGI